MKDNKLLIIGGVVALALLFAGKGGSNKMFTIPPGVSAQLPQGGTVSESQLPQYGFIQYQGQWYHQSQFQAPPGTDSNSQQWYQTLMTALQTGQQLYVTAGTVAAGVAKTIKSTAVDWNMSSVNVNIVFGFLTWSGPLTPISTVTKNYGTQSIQVTNNGAQTVIKLLQNGQIVKQATIDFYNEKLIGFDAGSVGISGVYIGECGCSNLDNPINISSIGAVYNYEHPKALSHCANGKYSDAYKGACSSHGGVHEIKMFKGKRSTTGKGTWEHYSPYRKAYKSNWAKSNKKKAPTDRIITL